MECIEFKGIVRIYEGRKEKLIAEFPNLVLNTAKQKLLTTLKEDIQFLVIGDGTNPVRPEDIFLHHEQFRKPVSNKVIFGNERLIVDTFIDANEANFTWKEVGLVGKSNLLYNRALVNDTKNSGTVKTISWEIYIN